MDDKVKNDFFFRNTFPLVSNDPYYLLYFFLRQVACRKLDNMIELTSHQFNILVLGFLGRYAPFF
jgi:hypothetical protein